MVLEQNKGQNRNFNSNLGNLILEFLNSSRSIVVVPAQKYNEKLHSQFRDEGSSIRNIVSGV